MTESVSKIDYSSINKIIDKVASTINKALPHPIFKIHSILKSAKMFGILALLTLIIGLILTAVKAIKYRNSTYLVITEYEDNKVIKTSSKIIDGKADEKCTTIIDELNKSKKIKKCNNKVKIWLRYLIFTLIGFIAPFLLIMPVANILHAKKKYFSNPYHNTLIDYLLRFFYPLKWGEVWDNQRYDEVRKGQLLKSLYGEKK